MRVVETMPMQQLLSETARRHRWTTAEYRKLIEAGVFTEDDRIELIEGELIEMAPIGEEHAGQVNLLGNEFSYRLYGRVVVAVQNPITLGEYSDPQPDIALLRWRADFYRRRRPEPEDILLIVEVSETSVRYDREVKLPLYARHGIPECWLVDLRKPCLEIHRDPTAEGYREVTTHRTGTVAPADLPEAIIDVARLLGGVG